MKKFFKSLVIFIVGLPVLTVSSPFILMVMWFINCFGIKSRFNQLKQKECKVPLLPPRASSVLLREFAHRANVLYTEIPHSDILMLEAIADELSSMGK